MICHLCVTQRGSEVTWGVHLPFVCLISCVGLRRDRAMWFTTPENSFRMSSFKTKIRRRKYALTRGNSSAGDKRKEEESHGAKGVPADWEFVNFNPVIFGRRGIPQGVEPPQAPLLEQDEDAPDGYGSVKRRTSPSPPASRPNSRPPSWLAALPHHFVMEESDEGNLS
ncbi:hypothetical protein J6590_089683 [Homalodisca vitripennis]|nr:hypothetical protein J6590_089683 [Homalodisca vitripennis]